jgi:hypothetical protein
VRSSTQQQQQQHGEIALSTAALPAGIERCALRRRHVGGWAQGEKAREKPSEVKWRSTATAAAMNLLYRSVSQYSADQPDQSASASRYSVFCSRARVCQSNHTPPSSKSIQSPQLTSDHSPHQPRYPQQPSHAPNPPCPNYSRTAPLCANTYLPRVVPVHQSLRPLGRGLCLGFHKSRIGLRRVMRWSLERRLWC